MTSPVREEAKRGLRNITLLVCGVTALNVFLDNDEQHKPTDLASTVASSRVGGYEPSAAQQIPSTMLSRYIETVYGSDSNARYPNSFLDVFIKDMGLDQRRQICIKKPYLRR